MLLSPFLSERTGKGWGKGFLFLLLSYERSPKGGRLAAKSWHIQHQIFPAIDLNVSPKWEFNFGVGIGITRSTDHLILKMIIGRRFTFGRRSGQAKDSAPLSVDEP